MKVKKNHMYPNNWVKFFLLAVVLSMAASMASAQRRMENLDRGLVAVKITNGVFLSWRIQGYEWYGVAYNVYRDGTLLNSTPLEVSNYTDATGTTSSSYTVTSVVDGIEQEHSTAVTPMLKQYLEINMKSRNTSLYQINDATAADLDGDGQYEIIVKRLNTDYTTGNDSAYSYFEAYKMDGTFMWEINVGPNILSSSGVEINIAAFDLDEDGKAEVFMRTSEGTIFGDGSKIGDTDGDGVTNYRYSVTQTSNMQYMTAGPEFLSLINGETGAELDRVDFIPRGSASDWGDSYGHRANKFFFGAPYLDGVKPSIFIGRGIYTKTVMRTYDVVDKKLVFRWEWSATSSSDPYYAQGNHNYTIADVDEDGRDEIVWGSMTVDDNGSGLYSTQFGHGDAMHVGDLDPFHKGTEVFKCIEDSPNWGTAMWDGATGEVLIHHYTTSDCGRCCAANISDDIKGCALWGGSIMYSASTREEAGTSGGPENFRIYWDGDLLEETLDHTDFTTTLGYGTGAIYKYQNGGSSLIFTAGGAISCNYTKGTPTLQADLFGDWREEVVWRNEANTTIRIYTTIDSTTYRNYTLMHDHQYRQAICWQMCGYNQPPHTSYFLGEGEGITVPPPPVLTNNRLVYAGTGTWDKSSAVWEKDGEAIAYSDDTHVLFDVSSGTDVSLTLNETVSPKVVTVNSVGNYTIEATSGRLSGSMILVKQGLGTLTLDGIHDYTGKTEIWNGQVNFDGNLQYSPVWLGFFGKMGANGKLSGGVTMRYSSELFVGGEDTTGVLTVANGLTMEEASILAFDLYAPSSTSNDSLVVDGNFTFADNVVFSINPKLSEGETKLASGEYLLAKVTGNISGNIENVTIDGILGTPAELKVSDGNIYLVIKGVRSATSVVWNGDKTGSIWDMATTENFLNGGVSDIFVDRDAVTFNDDAISKTVNIGEEVTPSSVIIDASSDYLFQGNGSISGSATFTKKGSGTLIMSGTNSFTGKVSVEAGIVKTGAMPTSTQNGSLGMASSDPSLFEINGGTLWVTGEGTSDRAISVGANGGTIQNDAKIIWNPLISGGVLTKTGSGNLVMAGVNTHTKTILQQGTLTLQNDETNPGDTVVIEGGTLQCYDNAYTYNTLSWSINVPSGKTGTINLDSRGYYTGTLTGSGTLNVNIPFVRSDINGDWSAFSGNISFTSTYSNSSGYSAELRVNNSKGLPNAFVTVNSSVSASNTSGTVMILGALAGTGTLSGEEAYKIGNKGSDSEFSGTISAGSLTKAGSGKFTLSGANTYTGTTTVSAGTLYVSNKSGSATGTGAVSVSNGGTLAGTGIITGALSVESGGTLTPGSSSVGTKLTVSNSVNLKSGSILSINANPLFDYTNTLVATGTITISGKLVITNATTTTYSEGDSFKLFSCSSITGGFTSISPEIPGDGLVWDTTELLTSGVIKVAKNTSKGSISKNGVSVYPNPVTDVLFIEVSSNRQNMSVTLYDMAGKERLHTVITSTGKSEIDMSGLSKGVYFLKIEEGESLFTQKIVKY